MGAAKKLEDLESMDSPSKMEGTDEVPLWKRKKRDREKLLRAIRAKFFTDTIRTLIRTELKKDQDEEDD